LTESIKKGRIITTFLIKNQTEIGKQHIIKTASSRNSINSIIMEYSDDTTNTPINLKARQHHPASNMLSGGDRNNIFDSSNTNSQSNNMMNSNSRMSQSYGGLDHSSSFLLRQGILPPAT
jgi:hypothetical protein